MSLSPEDAYHDPATPANRAYQAWLEDRPLSAEAVEALRDGKQNPDRRVAQLCTFLLDLLEDEEAALQRNDSFTLWLLTERNAHRLGSRLRRISPKLAR